MPLVRPIVGRNGRDSALTADRLAFRKRIHRKKEVVVIERRSLEEIPERSKANDHYSTYL